MKAFVFQVEPYFIFKIKPHMAKTHTASVAFVASVASVACRKF